MPAGFVPYRRTPTFDERSIPAGLLREHATKPGVWGLIHVLEGRLLYRIQGDGARTLALGPGHLGAIPPEVPHCVRPEGPVRFYVEFHARSRSG